MEPITSLTAAQHAATISSSGSAKSPIKVPSSTGTCSSKSCLLLEAKCPAARAAAHLTATCGSARPFCSSVMNRCTPSSTTATATALRASAAAAGASGSGLLSTPPEAAKSGGTTWLRLLPTVPPATSTTLASARACPLVTGTTVSRGRTLGSSCGCTRSSWIRPSSAVELLGSSMSSRSALIMPAMVSPPPPLKSVLKAAPAASRTSSLSSHSPTCTVGSSWGRYAASWCRPADSSTSESPRHTPWRVPGEGSRIPFCKMGTISTSTRSPILRTISPRQRPAAARRSSPSDASASMTRDMRSGRMSRRVLGVLVTIVFHTCTEALRTVTPTSLRAM
mmetsp:Transcript_65318/g.206343  ORF Transcript_65318/g.206343 Transcript_65318/m.206343 type:complete len:337 (+) Transcript_65318:832-1842(+)